MLYTLGQSVYACYTLYKAIGNQIDIYGFTAFGLTVVPYALMSVLNIIATLVTPSYPCMFLVETPDLEEARAGGGLFAGSVVSIAVDLKLRKRALPDFLSRHSSLAMPYWTVTGLLVLAPIAIVSGLSGFRYVAPLNNFVWITLWLCLGSVSCLGLKYMDHKMAEYTCQYSIHSSRLKDKHFRKWLRWWTLFTVPLFVPAVGGMVMVGYMLKEY